MVSLLLAAGAPADGQDRFTGMRPLAHAFLGGSRSAARVVRRLLAAGACGGRRRRLMHALVRAARVESPRMTRMMLQAGSAPEDVFWAEPDTLEWDDAAAGRPLRFMMV